MLHYYQLIDSNSLFWFIPCNQWHFISSCLCFLLFLRVRLPPSDDIWANTLSLFFLRFPLGFLFLSVTVTQMFVKGLLVEGSQAKAAFPHSLSLKDLCCNRVIVFNLSLGPLRDGFEVERGKYLRTDKRQSLPRLRRFELFVAYKLHCASFLMN